MTTEKDKNCARKDKYIHMRIDEESKNGFVDKAEKAGLKLSEWIMLNLRKVK